MDTSVIKSLMDEVILSAERVDELVRKNNLENEQYFLDWQDKLNNISVR